MTGLVSILVRTLDRCGDTNGSEGRTNVSAMQTVASQPRADAATQRHWATHPPNDHYVHWHFYLASNQSPDYWLLADESNQIG